MGLAEILVYHGSGVAGFSRGCAMRAHSKVQLWGKEVEGRLSNDPRGSGLFMK